jgi:hypothetical protein
VKGLLILLLLSAAALAQQPGIPDFKVDGVQWEARREQTISRPDPDRGTSSLFYGYTGCDQHVLQIRLNLPQCYERETVMHELMHAAMCNWRQFGESFEKTQVSGHEAIDRLAPKVMRIIADNPELANYFAAAPDCYKEKVH